MFHFHCPLHSGGVLCSEGLCGADISVLFSWCVRLGFNTRVSYRLV